MSFYKEMDKLEGYTVKKEYTNSYGHEYHEYINNGDFEDIKKGDLFGMLISIKDIKFYNPSIDYNGDYKIMREEIDFDLKSKILNNKQLLIFKKIDDNYATEMISNQKFRISDKSLFITKDENLSSFDFQNTISKLKGIYLDICPREVEVNVDERYYHSSILYTGYKTKYMEVNEEFIDVYSRYTLPNSDLIKQALKEVKRKSKAVFKKNVLKTADDIYDIAQVENKIYDFQRKK